MNSSASRSQIAMESDKPRPVQRITCAAKQAGHLGDDMQLGRSRQAQRHLGQVVVSSMT